MFAVKVITVLVLLTKVYRGVSTPQLNLPPLPTVSTTRPDIYHNSYTPNKFSDRDFSFDSDRSQRYGPPYSDQDDDRANDFRQGINNEDRDQNGYFYRDRPPYNRTNSFDRDRSQDYPRNTEDRYRFEQDRRYSVELERIRQFLTETDHKGSLECTANVIAQWTFETDVNEITQGEALLSQQRFADYQHFVYDEIKRIDRSTIFDQDLYRQLMLLSNVGPSALPPDQLDRFHRLINDMLAIYNTATVCKYQQPFQCGLRLQVELKEIMARSRDWDELQHVWTEWRRKTGFAMRDLYEQLIDLVNDVAVSNNYTNGGEYWFSAYESSNFREDIESVWSQVLPLYELIHAYVRRKLREYYGPDKINRNAPIPAHILGNMYGQSWTNILDIIIPYPGKSFIDVTPKMLEQGYTPLIMFQLADEFFQSMNMTGLSPDFWINSIIEQPVDRPVICQPSAWDFCNRRDFRVKMCTNVNHKDLVTVHHEMAHVQYFLNYRHQPKVFRDGANPGFHEAIGDAIGLSVSTPKHLQTLGLIQKSIEDSTYDINFLFAMAVDKVVFLPFALALEAWRYDVFSRRSSKEMLNCHYWDLREQFGGIKPPVLRSEKDFDPGAKYHIPANIPYMKTVFFLESEDDPIQGNGTNIFWTKVEVCCEGYKSARDDPNICVPDCGNKCTFGTCIAPNECICFDSYVKNADNDCVPTCPNSCLNGYCLTSGTCNCNPGYELDKKEKFCRPICSGGCNEHQNCSRPEWCQCLPGYTSSKDGKCVFQCNFGCGDGDCIGPNKCKCRQGYILRDGVCRAECSQRCENGSCRKKDICSCDHGYDYDVHTTSCLPKCDGCIHGVCIARNVCKCFKGYNRIRNSCKPCSDQYGYW